MSEPTSLHYYVIFKRGRWYRSVQVKRFTMREPVLRAGEVAIKVNMLVPYEILVPQTTKLAVTEQQIIRPNAETKQG